MIENLANLLKTLESIEVHGAQNLSRLLGCIEMIRNMLKALQDEQQQKE